MYIYIVEIYRYIYILVFKLNILLKKNYTKHNVSHFKYIYIYILLGGLENVNTAARSIQAGWRGHNTRTSDPQV